MLSINKILAPTDFSDCSFKGVSWANDLATHFGSELLLIHVVSAIPSPAGVSYSTAGLPQVPDSGNQLAGIMSHLNEEAKRSMDHALEICVSKDLSPRSFVLNGLPSTEIIRVAEEENVDLIVMSTHGMGGWRKFIFGSVADKVLKMAECPVIAVPCSE